VSLAESPFHLPGSILVVASRVLETLGFESESQLISWALRASGTRASHPTLGALGQPEKAIGHESHIRTMVGTSTTVLLCCFRKSRTVATELAGGVVGDWDRD
jgi:hypothetical protein